MYQQSLSQSWENLVSDFIVAHRGMSASQLNAGAIEEWYRIRTQRYRSVAYLEGIAIDQLGKPDFAQELRNKIDAFTFAKRAPEQLFSPAKALTLALLPGVAAGVLSAVCTDWPLVWPIAIGCVLMGAGVVSTANHAQHARSKAASDLVQAYADQLSAHLSALQTICEKHGID